MGIDNLKDKALSEEQAENVAGGFAFADNAEKGFAFADNAEKGFAFADKAEKGFAFADNAEKGFADRLGKGAEDLSAPL